MEERNERNAGKNRTPQKQHAAKIKKRNFSTHTHTQREKKKESKIHEGPFYSFPKKKERKSLVWMIRTVPQWHQKSHCAVDICVSSLSCSNEKTNDRSIAAQTINVCAVHCSFVLFSFPGKKNRKKKWLQSKTVNRQWPTSIYIQGGARSVAEGPPLAQ